LRDEWCERDCGLRACFPICPHERDADHLVEWSAWTPVPGPYALWKVVPRDPLTAAALWERAFSYADKQCVAGKSWLRHIVTSRVQHDFRRHVLRKLNTSDAFVGFDWSRQFEFLQPYMITKSSFTSEKANILVVYVAQRNDDVDDLVDDVQRLVLDDDSATSNDDVDDLVDDVQRLVLDDDSDGDEDAHFDYQVYFFISDPTENSPKKNAGIAQEALEKVFALLRVGKPGGTRRVFLGSDGEFRTRKNFAWFGDVAHKHRADFFWSFYCSGHGKDIYDGEGGVFKNAARRFVKRKATRDFNPISSLADLVSFGREHMAYPQRGNVARRHFFLQEGKVSDAKDGVRVEGSSKMYAFRCQGSKGSATVEARGFSCPCNICLRFGDCRRPGGPWETTVAAFAGGIDGDMSESD
jgi:hypothetical protein